ncbi:VOC family protein [Micromonospora deserti]|uniref:VOC family protein n=1 Tax=Micromonospora deserti TaxID=2070366 RepID=UPI003F698D3F
MIGSCFVGVTLYQHRQDVRLFCYAAEGKTVKNRLHLDLEPTDRTRDEEVERLLGIGAAQVADQRRPDGSGWVVLADPEGNEFCVLRSAAERAAAPAPDAGVGPAGQAPSA